MPEEREKRVEFHTEGFYVDYYDSESPTLYSTIGLSVEARRDLREVILLDMENTRVDRDDFWVGLNEQHRIIDPVKELLGILGNYAGCRIRLSFIVEELPES